MLSIILKNLIIDPINKLFDKIWKLLENMIRNINKNKRIKKDEII